MNTRRYVTAGLPVLLLASLVSPLTSQTAPKGEPPSGFSGVPWGSGSDRLIETFGTPLDVDGEQLRWNEVPVLGKNALVLATVRRGVGLSSGIYVWMFGTEDLSRVACGIHAVQVRQELVEKYGAPTRNSEPSGKCSEIYAIWEWPEPDVRVDLYIELYTQVHATYGYNVFLQYRDRERDQAADRADVEDRL